MKITRCRLAPFLGLDLKHPPYITPVGATVVFWLAIRFDTDQNLAFRASDHSPKLRYLCPGSPMNSFNRFIDRF